MPKYPFGLLAVGESYIVRNVRLGSAQAALHRYRDELKPLDWPAAFKLTKQGPSNRDIRITRLPDGTKLKPGRPPQSAADRALKGRLRAEQVPLLVRRARAGFDSWLDLWHQEREQGRSPMPPRDLLDLLQAHAPELYRSAVEISARPLKTDANGRSY